MAAKRETYEAFKERKRRELDGRHGEWTQDTQQKLLRVRLHHFLLTMGAKVDQKRRPGNFLRNLEDDANGMAGGLPQGFASEQKRLAVARETVKAKRQRSADTIQRFIRRRRHLRLRDENELPSTSMLVALELEKSITPSKVATITTSTSADIFPVDLPPTVPLPSYEVVLELIAARNLALVSPSSGGKYIELELHLKRQSDGIARVVSTRQFVSSFHDEVPVQDCSLRFALDLNDDIRHGITSPQIVVDEVSVMVIVKAIESSVGGMATTLGVVNFPLSLLETPLATQYALCRWFPLEKAYPGHTVRGDLRLSVCYLMRQTVADCVTMVPYATTKLSKSLRDEARVQQESKKPATKRRTKAPATAVSQPQVARKSFLRHRAEQAAGKPAKVKSPILSPKDSASSPIGRISRAEALSPPPSPSSVTSSETCEMVESPRTERRSLADRRSCLPKRHLKPVDTSSPKEEQVDQTKGTSTRPTYLKRKPYKVVFHKLDWSQVASKTDCRMSTKGTSRSSSDVALKTSQLTKPHDLASPSIPSNSGTSGTSTDLDCGEDLKPRVFIDAATAHRLSAFETAMYKQCHVTRETASLARFKYQKERDRAVANHSLAHVDGNSQHESIQNEQQPIPNASMNELWKTLAGDSSGEMYATMLRHLTAEPPIAAKVQLEEDQK